jgi:hypothetical protein
MDAGFNFFELFLDLSDGEKHGVVSDKNCFASSCTAGERQYDCRYN